MIKRTYFLYYKTGGDKITEGFRLLSLTSLFPNPKKVLVDEWKKIESNLLEKVVITDFYRVK